MALLGDILLRFRADTRELDQGFTQAERQSRTFADNAARQGLGTIPLRADPSGLADGFTAGQQHARTWAQQLGALLQQELRRAMPFTISGYLTDTLNKTYGMVRNAVVGMNAQLEDTTLQFTTLMKDADKAKEHVKGLFVFAKDTPFETQPIIQASRLLQTFGGNALNTNDELLRVGNAAAVASTDIGNLAFWYGRLYTSVKNGQPFGEAAARLQELGVMSGELRMKMEGMQKAGASGPEIWAEWQKAMDANAGAMKRMAGTYTGLISTIQDTVAISGATVFKPLFDGIKEGLMLLVAALSTSGFDDFVQALATGVQRVVGAAQGLVENLLPILAGIWGIFEPLVAQAASWGSGFVSAFAGGIASAVNVVFDALGGLARGITDLLIPHSPPKILPNLDKWGTKAAEVWMGGWKQADYSLFSQIGSSIQKALQFAVGTGKLSEQQEIPVLSQVKAAVAELMSKRDQGGTFFEDDLLRVKEAAGPAGESVYELVDAYMKLDWASRQVAAAQEEVNAVSEHYSAIIDPLNAQLTGVRRQMGLLRDQQQLAQINQKLATATGSDRQLLLLQRQELTLQRQISSQTDARDAAMKAAQEQAQAAQKKEQQMKDELANLQAKQQLEAESLATAKQQAALLERIAKEAGAAGAAGAEAANAVTQAIDDTKTEIGLMQARVQGVLDQMAAARERGRKMFTPVTEGASQASRVIQAMVRESGLDVFLGSVQYLLTGEMGPALDQLVRNGSAFTKELVGWRYGIVKFGLDARQAVLSVVDGLRYLATGQMGKELAKTFAIDGAFTQGLVRMRAAITRFGADAQEALIGAAAGLRFLVTGTMPQRVLDTFGPDSLMARGLVLMRAGMIAFAQEAVAAFTSVRNAAGLLVTGAKVGDIFGLSPDSPAIRGLLLAHDAIARLIVLLRVLVTGEVRGGLFRALEMGDGTIARILAVRGAILRVLEAFRGGDIRRGLSLLGDQLVLLLRAAGQRAAQALVDVIPDGIRQRIGGLVAQVGPILAGVFGGITLGPAIASALAPIGALLAPIGAALAPVIAGVGSLGGLLGPLVPSVSGLGAALMTLLNPFALISGAVGAVTGLFALLGQKLALGGVLMAIGGPLGVLRAGFAGLVPLVQGFMVNAGMTLALLINRVPSLRVLVAGLWSALTRLGPSVLNLSRSLLGLVSPVGIVITLVGALVGAFVSDFGGIREVTATTLGPLAGLLGAVGAALLATGQALLQGNLGGALDVLGQRFALMGPQLQTAAQTLQAGLPQIFAILMAYLGQVAGQIIGWVGAMLPRLITMLGTWANAFIAWVLPMIPPMLAALGGLLGSVLDAIGAALPGIVESLAAVAAQFVAWVGPQIPPLLLALGGLLSSLLGWIVERAPSVLAQLAEWGLKLVEWVGPQIPPLLLALGGLLASFLGWIVEKAPDILAKLGEWGSQFVTWARDEAGPRLVSALGTMFTTLWEELKRLWGAAFNDGSIGKSLVDGLKSGIQAQWASFSSWFVQNLTDMIPDWARGPLGVGADGADGGAGGAGGEGDGTGGPPHRASGGDVRRGVRYLVGEHGPEYFIAPADGAIEPNSVYRAVTNPLAQVAQQVVQGQVPAQAGEAASAAVAGQAWAVPTYPAGSGRIDGAPKSSGGVPSVSITINNPVVDSDARLEQLRQELMRAMSDLMTGTFNRLLLAEGA